MADYSEADYSEMMRDFTQFMDEIEREMYQSKEGVCLPDEIDLYNFFETWGGRAFFLRFLEIFNSRHLGRDMVMIVDRSNAIFRCIIIVHKLNIILG